MKIIIFALISLIFSIGIVPAFAEHQDTLSPYQQMKNGVAPEDVICKFGLSLMIRTSGNAACVKSTNVEKLTNAGFGILEKEALSDNHTDMLSIKETKDIAEKAFIYAYPILENYKTMYGNTIDEFSTSYKAPFNIIFNEKRLYTPIDTDVVSPNSDTLYSRIWVDLRTEPIILSINPVEDRYFVFQLVDFYTHNFDYIGTRATGEQGGDFLIAGPNWDGKIPDGIDKVFQSETDFNFIVGRTQVLDKDDLDNTISIISSYKLLPLSQYIQQESPSPAQKIDFIPWNKEQAHSTNFINYFNLALTWSEISESEKELFEEFSKIGIKTGEHVNFETMDPEIKNAIESGVDSALDKINQNIPNLGEFENGWTKVNAFGDRNFHGDDYLRRASAAMFALYGNTMDEAFYPSGTFDKDRIPLDASKNNYVIKFSEEPPVDAFWSVTMYDANTRVLVENPIDRWLVNSLTGLEKNDDGTFEIYIQHESPSEDLENNWLPAPNGGFYVILRLYLPDQSIMDGVWKMPIIEKTSQTVSSSMDINLNTEEAKIAEEAFIYFYPMLEMYKTMYTTSVDESSETYSAPFNVFHHAEKLATSDDTWVVSPNSDTLYTRTWLDLRAEPVVLIVPPIDSERYYTFQFIDFFTHNFGYVGTRATGNEGGTYLIAGPNWDGNSPEGIDKILQSETDFVWILARTQVFNQDDVSNALSVMKTYDLKPLSQFLNKPSPSVSKIEFIPWDQNLANNSEFIQYANLILTWIPIDDSEKNLFNKFSKIGISLNTEFESSMSSDVNDGVQSALTKIDENMSNIGEIDNGWTRVNAFGDRNFHGDDYLRKASGVMIGLGANSPVEAFYPVAFIDSNNNSLDASISDYVIKFSSEPPVNAFWSLTMYDKETKLLVENPIDRWLVNSLTGLEKNEDGTFEIYVQHESPEDLENNWLPAPDDEFYLVLRLYFPDDSIFDKTWKLPSIEVIK